MKEHKEFVFALAGNPNSGKTTLFNELTGSHYNVGNWAGVTVERKEGICKYVYHKHESHYDTHEHQSVHKHDEAHDHIRIVDLPGIYSLSPYSAEEVVSRDFIVQEKPDLILNIVDATNLERNLYLTTQLAELETPMIIALNMMDALESNGFTIDIAALEQQLGIRVMPISASKGKGIQDLVTEALEIASRREIKKNPVEYPLKTEEAIHAIKQEDAIPRFCALKLLEGDKSLADKASDAAVSIAESFRSANEDIESKIAQSRYRFIRKCLKKSLSVTGKNRQWIRTEKIDKVVNHPIFAIPIFILVMFLVFQITFGPFGSMLSDGMDYLVNEKFSSLVTLLLSKAGVGDFASGLLVDGIIAGVGGVVTFFPQIMLLFLFLSFLEDSGYMARTAFIMDRLFMKLGLSGKSFVPMIMGFGCTVPAVMSARTLENRRDQRLTVLLAPFMSCSAKMPVYATITAAIFPKNAGIITFSLYFLGILLGAFSGMIFSKTVLKGDPPPFILELPPYRMPTVKSTFHHMWDKAKDFAIRAGTVLLAASIIIWFMQNLTIRFTPAASSEESIFHMLGTLIAPIFAPCGYGTPEAAVSLLSGIAAKEAVISTMSILYNAADTSALITTLSQVFTPASAYAFLVFILLYIPCIAAVSAIRSELRSIKLTIFSVVYQLSIAWIMSFLAYHILSWIL